ncbi:MAG: DNA-directed RNA polymerase [Candidatus Altiarchaeota archaeon]|nr:DNA-directed RNA polymerase [Candidatus Altiarchaeota archaeon]
MFEIATIKQNVRVPPRLWKKNIKLAVKAALRELEGKVSKMHGILLSITDVKSVGEGKILPGDGAVYFPTDFEALIFRPELNEVVDSEVTDMTEFGAFLRVGALDGLVHVSQVSDDFFSYSKEGVLQGKQSKQIVKIGDKVRARIISVSYKAEPAKLGLTMRQPGLGKWEWLEANRIGNKKE